MVLVTEASEFPDAQFHTVSVESDDNGKYYVSATSRAHSCVGTVDSVALDGEGVGVESGTFRLGAAERMMEITYVDFEEYTYDEMQIEFVEKR